MLAGQVSLMEMLDMAENRAVVYKGPCRMAVEDIGFPRMEAKGRPVDHAVILQVLATNICGSDLHMYRGRTDLLPNTPVGHEITGMVIEKGSDVQFLDIGDIVSIPFNVACGRCRNCREGMVNICLTTNDLKPGAAYGYAEMGPWQGGQAEYVMVPYADFAALKFPDRELAMEKLLDLAMLSDIFPTGYHAAVTAGVTAGSTVYIAGAGPVGICAAVSSYLRGAACVIVGDYNEDRLRHIRETVGCETVNVAEVDLIQDQIAEIVGIPEVDCGIDAVGFEAHGHGHNFKRDVAEDVLDTLVRVTRAGGSLGIAGVYPVMDPQGRGLDAKMGRPKFHFGRAWDKAQSIRTGQTPVMKYNRQLMTAMLFDRVRLSRALNTTVIGLEDAPEAYDQFEDGSACKFVLDPHGVLSRPRMPEAREFATI